MLKLNKKGFTIVELVIVIVIVAILAAVLIPTFVGLIRAANTSADIQLVTNLNKALAMQEALDGKNATMQNALDDALANGYDMPKLTPTSEGNDIVWNQEDDRFALVTKVEEGGLKVIYDRENKDGKTVAPADVYKFWKIYDEETGFPTKQTYSIYWGGAKAPESFSGNVSVGFDAGKCSEITSVTYTPTNSSKDAVRIRTVAGNLTVAAPEDTVSFYGYADEVHIVKTAQNSFHVHGDIALLRVGHGRVVLESDSNVSNLHFVATGGKFDDITLDLTNAQQIPALSRDNVTGSNVLIYKSVSGATETDIKTDSANSPDVKNESELNAAKEKAKEEHMSNVLREENKAYVCRVGNQGYLTFEEAVAAAQVQGNPTITLLSDITIDHKITIGGYKENNKDLYRVISTIEGTKNKNAADAKNRYYTITVTGNGKLVWNYGESTIDIPIVINANLVDKTISKNGFNIASFNDMGTINGFVDCAKIIAGTFSGFTFYGGVNASEKVWCGTYYCDVTAGKTNYAKFYGRTTVTEIKGGQYYDKVICTNKIKAGQFYNITDITKLNIAEDYLPFFIGKNEYEIASKSGLYATLTRSGKETLYFNNHSRINIVGMIAGDIITIHRDNNSTTVVTLVDGAKIKVADGVVFDVTSYFKACDDNHEIKLVDEYYQNVQKGSN